MGEGRRHEDDGVGGEREPVGAQSRARGQRVAGVHHPLRLPGGARGVADFDDLVRIDPALVEQRSGVDLVLPALLDERGSEAVLAFTPQHEDVIEAGKLPAKTLDHRFVLEPAEDARNEERAGFGEREHEFELARPEDRHQRVRNRSDAHAREVERSELPPVGELERHHVALLDAVGGEARPDAARDPIDVAVGEGGANPGLGLVVGDEDLVRVVAQGLVEIVAGGAVRPVPGRGGGLDSFPGQHDEPIVADRAARLGRVHGLALLPSSIAGLGGGSVPPGPARAEGRGLEAGLYERCMPGRARGQACWAANLNRGCGSRIGQCSAAATMPSATAIHHTMS